MTIEGTHALTASILHLYPGQARQDLHAGHAIDLEAGIKVISSRSGDEALLEVDKSLLTGDLSLDGEPVYSIKPWRSWQYLSSACNSFVLLPYFGSHIYSAASAERSSALAELLANLTPPQAGLQQDVISKIAVKKSSVISWSALTVVSVLLLVQHYFPMQSANIEAQPSAVAAPLSEKSQDLRTDESILPSPVKTEESLVEASITTTAVGEETKPVASKQELAPHIVNKESKHEPKAQKVQPTRSVLTGEKEKKYRDELQRFVLEARFDPERAQQKMRELLTKVPSGTELARSIQQEISLAH